MNEKAKREFDRIQRHRAFTEIFKTPFEPTVLQTEIDVLGLDQENTVYAANVTFHEYGINFGSKTDTRNRVIKNLLRAYLALICYFPGQKHVLMYCSPKVTGPTEDVIRNYFKILKEDFTSEQAEFIYLSNEDFRDQVLMGTLDCTHDQFDTSELFLRSFKLLTAYTSENEEPSESSEPHSGLEGKQREKDQGKGDRQPDGGVETNLPDNTSLDFFREPVAEKEFVHGDENGKVKSEIEKVKNRVPKWFKRSGQNNSKILIRFLTILEKSETVNLQQLADACVDVKNFMGNFAQMNNIADKNHGKVFAVTGDVVNLWEPVKDFIIQEYIEFKKSYYSE